ncbi:uncharacterized protein MONOS_7058 [Monocercomonoides exilis]|uniref:uncharacterized protein n=1 Tax=Monocercomonoides exilis TaxID=2049356 RepID=UPI003559B471|nr:hypothetical protein MONOS_7058 [Monocercomonoides exilis]|eukprot:MONOS_7058.1-p1 / transcript=MONOS_7058.1 / gene=MONOS_7058 / organism=Monocercomonoides_exilis_PA203 / gene_product=unspecified product / transcript_product=unspecified product / location=Mono_scaffold00233:60261-68952(+) / protein_length=2867 / sequence_SO=supercontig / SO=protein_coding / is_pseudo=false
MNLCQSNRNSLFLVDSLSSARIEDCQIFIEKSQTKWIVESFGGRTVFSNVSLAPEKSKSFVPCIQHDGRTKNWFEDFSSLELNFCHFSSFCVDGTQPFVGSSDAQRVFVSGCAFENVSHSNVEQNVCPQSLKRNMIGGKCFVTNSQFSSVDNAYYGSIFEGLITQSGMFGAFNSTFEKSTKTVIATRCTNRNDDIEFVDCIFTDLTGSNGGAINHISSGSATIVRCDFVRCWSSVADGAILLNQGKQNMVNCSFSFCWSNQTTGGATFLNAAKGTYVGLNFSSCLDSKGGNCAHFRNGQSSLFDSCCFVNGTTTGNLNGGALEELGSNPATITNCLFKNNTASQVNGGGITFNIYSDNYANEFSIEYCLFDNNTAKEGHDFYASSKYASVINFNCFVGCRSLSSNLTGRRVVIEGGSASDDWIPLFVGKVHANGGNGTDEWICGTADRPCKTLNHSLWMSDVRREMQEFVFGKGVYGDTELAVNAMWMKFEGSGASSTSMEPRAEGGAGMKITSGKLIVEKICLVHNSGLWKGSHLLKIEGRAGVAELRDAVLRSERSAEEDEQAEVFEKSAIEIGDGELICNNVSMKWMKSKLELVRIGAAGTARIEASTFLEIERSEGDGSAFCGVVENGKVMELNGISFEGCKCLSGSGGALWLEMKMGSRVGIGNMTGSDEKTMFESCSAGGSETRGNGGGGYGGGVYLYVCEGMRDFVVKNVGFSNCEARAGKNMFVSADDLQKVINTTTIEFQPNMDVYDELSGFERSTANEKLVIALVVYLREVSVPTIVGSEDGVHDFSRCGCEMFACRTIKGAIDAVGSAEEHRIRMREGYKLDGEAVIEGGHFVFDTVNEWGEIVVGTDTEKQQDALLMLSADTQIIKMTLVLKESLCGREAFVEVMDKTLSMENNKMKMMEGVTAVDYEYVRVTGGKLVMRNCEIVEGKHVIFGENGMLSVKGEGELEMDGVMCKGVGSTGVDGIVVVSSSGKSHIHNCEFEGKEGCESGFGKWSGSWNVEMENVSVAGIKRRTGDGGCFAFGGGNGIKMEGRNCTMSGCSVSEEESSGGGIKVELGVASEFKLDGWKVNGCSAQGRGGGIFLIGCAGSKNDFVLNDIEFGGNSAAEGKDVFVECDDLVVGVVKEKFVDIRGREGESVEMEGIDRGYFKERAASLDLFLKEYVGGVVDVCRTGVDVIGCGSEEYPCKTLLRGYKNAKQWRGKKTLNVSGAVEIEDKFDVSMFEIVKNEGAESARLTVKSVIEGEKGSSVLGNTASMLLRGMEIGLPVEFVHDIDVVILSRSTAGGEEEAVVEIEKCTFVGDGTGVREYAIIAAEGGVVRISECEMSMMDMTETGFAFQCSVVVDGCTFSECRRTVSGEGGVMRVVIENGKEMRMNNTKMKTCRCDGEGGKGGFLWMDCRGNEAETPFIFGEGCEMEVNKAAVGRNMFIFASKLNSCVSVNSFLFDVGNWSNDRNGFVGNDSVFTDTDLLRFVILFKGRIVHVAEDGYDVMSCGSIEDPCMSLWQGLMHVEDCEEERMIEIMEKTKIDDRLDVSGIKIEAHGGTMIEGDAKATIVVEVKQRMEGVGLANSKNAGFEGIRFEVVKDEECLKTAIMANNEGVLSLTRCALSIEENEFVGEIVFVHMIKGELKGKGIEMESESVCNGMFVVESGCRCVVEELKVEGCKVKSGALICVRVGMEADERKGNIDDQEAGIGIANSSIGWVDGEGSDAVVVKSEGEVSVGAEVNGTKVEGCKCGRSTKGGGMCWQMSAGGWLRVSECSVVQCGCSGISGRGGGVFVGAEIDEVLDFVFEGDKFEGNTAYIGRHIFVACHNISSQINETQFVMDLRGISGQAHMISGSDTTDHREDTDLIPFITKYQSSTIFVSSGGAKGGENNRQCGKEDKCCETLGYGLTHIVHEYGTRVVVDEASEVETEIKLENLTLLAKGSRATVEMSRLERKEKGCVVECKGNVSVERISFEIPEVFPTEHEQIFCVEEGTLSMSECCVKPAEGCNVCRMPTLMHGERSSVTIAGLIVSQFACASLVECVECEVKLSEVVVKKGESRNGLICMRNGEMNVKELDVMDVRIENGPAVNMLRERGNENNGMLRDEKRRKQLRGDEKRMDVMLSKFSNISRTSEGACGVECEDGEGKIVLQNCSFAECESRSTRGIEASFCRCTSLILDSCTFVGALEENEQMKEKEGFERDEICRWNGSVVDVEESVVSMKDVSVSNSSLGGLSVKGGEVKIDSGFFAFNSLTIRGFPSARRNIICSDSSELNIMSLKGGDGVKDNSSLWILNDGCILKGIAEERASPLFIPILRSATSEQNEELLNVVFRGALLLPCNLSFRVTSSIGDVEQVETHEIPDSGFASEEEVNVAIESGIVRTADANAEVSVCILFGNTESPSLTQSFVLKNASITPPKGDERIVESGKEEKSSWALIVIVIFAVLFLIVLVVSIILAVRWRKSERRTEELEEIVNDNIKKDPKAFEMVTMEMSPEEQWRRAEKEAEKKNEERIKKRVYEKSLGHSESSEHLLSESGSTEYILGKDSDKIPEWMLEKVDEKEEEESRKRTPSPSISSTSTTDSDSTFIRPESMCPTTSSMSNLVDAMACSSPHEKLIVDLRDSLFMLLHGRNAKKEMAIGSLKEREQTASQIMFWVANLALHSFDEMENPLSSLSNLSPHIVLFSEHMVICIVMHSDLLSDDDSDSSSISSSIVATSATDDDDDESLPSSAFEDEDDFKKECLRWKAPELLMNKKMEATKESVAFSIGMMLWECLTLQIPFGEYPAEVAGQKIVNGEKPKPEAVENSSLSNAVRCTLCQQPNDRPALTDLKKEFIQHFPEGAMVMTIADAVDCQMPSECNSQIPDSSSSLISL